MNQAQRCTHGRWIPDHDCEPCNSAPQKVEGVVIDLQTAEYLAVLLGQTNWGNGSRRSSAAAALGEALKGHTLTSTEECFGKKAR